MAKLEVGHTEDGHSYSGGDPSNPASWVKIGAIEDGHIFKGGDPSSPDSWEIAQGPQGRPLEAFIQGFGNSATLGYLPQIQAATEPIIQGVMSAISGDNTDEKLREQGFQIENAPDQSYVQRRDQAIANQQQISKENPYPSTIGEIAGSIVSGIGTGGAAAAGKGLSLGKRFLEAGKVGALIGGAANPGDTEGQVSPLQIEERAKNAATSGALSLATQGLGEVVAKAGKTLRNAPGALDKTSKELAYRAIGPFKKNLKAAKGQNTAEQVGKTLIDKGIVQAGDTFEDIVQKSNSLMNETGSRIGSIYDDVEKTISDGLSNRKITGSQRELLEKSAPNGKGISESARKKITASMKNDTASGLSGAAKTSLEKLESSGEIPLKNLREMKTNLDKDIRYHALDKNSSDQQKQLKIIRDEVSGAIDRRISAAEKYLGKGSDLLKQLKQENKTYGHLRTASDVAQERIDANTANQFFSLTDKIMAGAGAAGSLATADSPEDMVKSGVLGLATAIASKNARKYGAPIASRAAKRLSVALQKPAMFAKYGKPLIEAARISPAELNSVLATYRNDPIFEKVIMDPGSLDLKTRGPAKSE